MARNPTPFAFRPARLFDAGRRVWLGPRWRSTPDAVSQLVAAAQAGDPSAWHTALTSLLPALRGAVQRHLVDPAAAEAVLQEALLQVHALRATCVSIGTQSGPRIGVE